MLKFIDIIEKSADPMPRTSALEIQPRGLVVHGNLPHGYRFEPFSVPDADNLIKWLQEWKRDNAHKEGKL